MSVLDPLYDHCASSFAAQEKEKTICNEVKLSELREDGMEKQEDF